MLRKADRRARVRAGGVPEAKCRVSDPDHSLVGVTLREYLRRKQLEEAERLILSTPLPMREIALHAGFGTTSTFYRCFKEAFGMPPGAFREVRK